MTNKLQEINPSDLLVETNKRQFHLLHKDAIMPVRKTKGSAGYDLHSIEEVRILPNETKAIPTGIGVTMNEGDVGFLALRSSIGLNRGLCCPIGFGIIDSDFEPPNTMAVIVTNTKNIPVTINVGERIAQFVFSGYNNTHNDEIPNTIRTSGIGSTNKNTK